ncbi:MAG: DUF169 domain-containing protein [Methanosarcinales archaeon]
MKHQNKWKMLGNRFGLDYLIVGVKIHKNELPSEWNGETISYCEAIKKVAEGTVDRIVLKEFECHSPDVVLGFVESRSVQLDDILEVGTKCVEIFAMKNDREADVLIFLVNAEQAMKIISTIGRGKPLNFKVSASLALCREATAIPILTHRPNISFLCGGARMYARFDKNVFALGIPKEISDIFFKIEIDLTPAEKYVLHILTDKGRMMSAKEISYDAGLPDRTVRNSLRSLHKKELIEKIIDIHDARTIMYRLKES